MARNPVDLEAIPAVDAASRPVVVYDGDCPFCRAQIARIRRRDRQGSFEYVARQTPGLTDRFPVLTAGDFNSGMRLITPQAEVFVGADAVYQIARRLPYWRRLAWLYDLPPLRALTRRAYGWIAAHRRSLRARCDDETCDV